MSKMKRIFILILSFCSIFLSVTVFLNYSDDIYSSVFDNKECVIIEEKENQSNVDFVNSLIALCNESNTGLFFTTIDNASTSKPTYNVYTTTLQAKFINISHNYNSLNINVNDYLTTNIDDDNTEYYIYGSTLYSHFRFYDFSQISNLQLSHSKFYIDRDSSNEFLALLADNDYTVSLITDENRMETSEVMTELNIMFIILTLFLFFSSICFAFSKRRDIVIKKANGYSEFSIFISTFLKELIIIPIICLATYLLSGGLVCVFYPNSFLDYFIYGISDIVTYIILSMILFVIACVYVQFKKNANEIRGNKPSRSLYCLAVIFRIIVSVVIAWGLTLATDAITYRNNLVDSKDSFSPVCDNYAVLSLNTGSTDFYNNTDEYMEKCNKFIKELSSKHTIVIVDSMEFMDSLEDYEQTIYINENYLKINPIYDTEGNLLNLTKVNSTYKTVLLPDNYSGTLIDFANQNGIEINVVYYDSGQTFKTFNQYVGIESKGLIIDPIVMLIDDETLYWKSQSLIGEQFLLIQCDSDEPFDVFKTTIDECGMSTVILEAQKLDTIFNVAITNANVKVSQYSIISIMYLIVLILVTLFETTVYYENNKRILTIKKIHGYGYRAYQQFAIYKLLILISISLCVFILNYKIFYGVLTVLIDVLLFAFYIKKLEKNSITMYLKGDM